MPAAAVARPVFLSPEAAQALIEDGARVLDARGGNAEAPYLPGAVETSWTDVRDGLLRVGRLTTADAARAHYEAKGVRLDRPVLVYGAAADGWGEEGRVWWDLRYLGHREVYILDGGVRAWIQARGRTASVPSGPLRGDFGPPRVMADLRANAGRVQALRADGARIFDARTTEEYQGATPFMSPRGGHVPGAHSLHWKTLLDPQGKLRTPIELESLLGSGDAPTVVYCTGGVRSAFVVAVLTHLGRPAVNYDGSWWDWSSQEDLPVE